MSEPEVKRSKIDYETNGEGAALEKQPEAKVIGKSKGSDGLEDPEDIQKALDEAEQVQNKIDELNKTAADEVLKVEQKYNSLRQPFFKTRNSIVENINNFWVTALENHPVLNAVIADGEQDCLCHLKKLEIEESDDIKSGYKIKLSFEENPFFENAQIVKEFHLDKSEPVSTTTEIKWKPGMNLVDKIKLKRGSGDEENAHISFFLWLTDNEDTANDEIAEVIKDDLYQNPMQYYLLPGLDDGEDEDAVSDSEEGAMSGADSADFVEADVASDEDGN